MTHICVNDLSITGSDNGWSTGRRRAIFSTSTGILLIWPLGTKFCETFSLKKCFSKCRLKNVGHFVRPQCVNTPNYSQCGWDVREAGYWVFLQRYFSQFQIHAINQMHLQCTDKNQPYKTTKFNIDLSQWDTYWKICLPKTLYIWVPIFSIADLLSLSFYRLQKY